MLSAWPVRYQETYRRAIASESLGNGVRAAGRARPGVKLALQSAGVKPAQLTTVFAGQDPEATARARSYFGGNPPTSPQIGLLKDGQLVYLMQRHQIEGRDAPEIAADLARAFEKHCTS